MTETSKHTLRLVENTNIQKDTIENIQETNRHITPPANSEFHTNPLYEKLLTFKQMQKKKRFTVEDLLKW